MSKNRHNKGTDEVFQNPWPYKSGELADYHTVCNTSDDLWSLNDCIIETRHRKTLGVPVWKSGGTLWRHLSKISERLENRGEIHLMGCKWRHWNFFLDTVNSIKLIHLYFLEFHELSLHTKFRGDQEFEFRDNVAVCHAFWMTDINACELKLLSGVTDVWISWQHCRVSRFLDD